MAPTTLPSFFNEFQGNRSEFHLSRARPLRYPRVGRATLSVADSWYKLNLNARNLFGKLTIAFAGSFPVDIVTLETGGLRLEAIKSWLQQRLKTLYEAWGKPEKAAVGRPTEN